MQPLQRYARQILRPLYVTDSRRVTAHRVQKCLEVLSAGTASPSLANGLIDDRGTVAKDNKWFTLGRSRDPAGFDQG